ncbi:MAG: hypothetical protein JWO44_496 [Bacteroidetes bacterium]|nr:hypothetical protein [Bacteroidota bacterium]
MRLRIIFLYVLCLINISAIYSQHPSDREIILKNCILQMKEYEVTDSSRTLTALYLYNDSGLVSTYYDIEFNEQLADTSCVTFSSYDSENRMVVDSAWYKKESVSYVTRYNYPKEDITAIYYKGNSSIYYDKEYRRKNLQIRKRYKNGKKFEKERSLFIGNHEFFKRWRHHYYERSICLMDNERRIVREKYKQKKHFYSYKRRYISSTHYYENGLLIKTLTTSKKNGIPFVHEFEYKKGICLTPIPEKQEPSPGLTSWPMLSCYCGLSQHFILTGAIDWYQDFNQLSLSAPDDHRCFQTSGNTGIRFVTMCREWKSAHHSSGQCGYFIV